MNRSWPRLSLAPPATPLAALAALVLRLGVGLGPISALGQTPAPVPVSICFSTNNNGVHVLQPGERTCKVNETLIQVGRFDDAVRLYNENLAARARIDALEAALAQQESQVASLAVDLSTLGVDLDTTTGVASQAFLGISGFSAASCDLLDGLALDACRTKQNAQIARERDEAQQQALDVLNGAVVQLVTGFLGAGECDATADLEEAACTIRRDSALAAQKVEAIESLLTTDLDRDYELTQNQLETLLGQNAEVKQVIQALLDHLDAIRDTLSNLGS